MFYFPVVLLAKLDSFVCFISIYLYGLAGSIDLCVIFFSFEYFSYFSATVSFILSSPALGFYCIKNLRCLRDGRAPSGIVSQCVCVCVQVVALCYSTQHSKIRRIDFVVSGHRYRQRNGVAFKSLPPAL